MVAADAVSGAVSSQRIGPGIQPHHLLGSRRGVVRNGTLQTFSKSWEYFRCRAELRIRIPMLRTGTLANSSERLAVPVRWFLYGLFSRLVSLMCA